MLRLLLYDVRIDKLVSESSDGPLQGVPLDREVQSVLSELLVVPPELLSIQQQAQRGSFGGLDGVQVE